jgi:hypothetical protein
MRKSLVAFAALAVWLMVGTAVRADSIPWGYSASDTAIFNNNNPVQSSSIAMKGSSGVASGNSGIIIYNLTTSSTAMDTSPDSFSSVPFNLAVTLTDIKATSSSSGTAKPSDVVNFSGLFSASNVTTKSLLPGPTSWTSPVTAEVTLGADDVGWRKYSVTISSITSPGQPGGAPGSIQAIVQIAPADGPGGSAQGPPPSATPEPASFVIAALGLPVFVLVRRRFKKAQA